MKHKVILLTGLVSAGKHVLADELVKLYPHAVRLDGDDCRASILCKDLGYTIPERTLVITKLAILAKKKLKKHKIVIVTVILPLKRHRSIFREIVGDENICLVDIATPLKACVARDNRHVYRDFKKGEISHIVGFDIPCKKISSPDVVVYSNSIYPAAQAAQEVKAAVIKEKNLWKKVSNLFT